MSPARRLARPRLQRRVVGAVSDSAQRDCARVHVDERDGAFALHVVERSYPVIEGMLPGGHHAPVDHTDLSAPCIPGLEILDRVPVPRRRSPGELLPDPSPPKEAVRSSRRSGRVSPCGRAADEQRKQRQRQTHASPQPHIDSPIPGLCKLQPLPADFRPACRGSARTLASVQADGPVRAGRLSRRTGGMRRSPSVLRPLRGQGKFSSDAFAEGSRSGLGGFNRPVPWVGALQAPFVVPGETPDSTEPGSESLEHAADPTCFAPAVPGRCGLRRSSSVWWARGCVISR